MRQTASIGATGAWREPQRRELGGIELGERRPPLARGAFEVLDVSDEALRDGAEGDLCREVEVMCEARDAEEQRSQLVLGLCPVAGRDRGLELRLTMAQVADHVAPLGALATRACHLLVHLLGADERRQRAGYSGQDSNLTLGLALLVLDPAPVVDDVLRVAHLDVGKDVRMATDELLGNAPGDVGDREASRLGG